MGHEQHISLENENQLRFLNSVFQSNDYIYTCGAKHEEAGKGYKNPKFGIVKSFETQLTQDQQFVCINPLEPINKNIKPDGSLGSRRSYQNVSRINSFLFEIDSIPLEDQLNLVPIITKNLPIKFVTYSGSKSLHFLIVLSDSLVNDCSNKELLKGLYKQYWQHLNTKLTSLTSHKELFDPACSDIARLTRLGGATRQSSNTTQYIMHDGPYANSNLFSDLTSNSDESLSNMFIKNLEQYNKLKKPINDSMNTTLFKEILFTHERGLLYTLQFPERWAKPANNYNSIFKYTLWAIDSTGVNKKTFTEFFTQHVCPFLNHIGYKSNPFLGINDAYRKFNL